MNLSLTCRSLVFPKPSQTAWVIDAKNRSLAVVAGKYPAGAWILAGFGFGVQYVPKMEINCVPLLAPWQVLLHAYIPTYIHTYRHTDILCSSMACPLQYPHNIQVEQLVRACELMWG